MLIPATKEVKENETKKRTRQFGRNIRSHTICVGTCGTYVGANHALHPRTEDCVLGSET